MLTLTMALLSLAQVLHPYRPLCGIPVADRNKPAIIIVKAVFVLKLTFDGGAYLPGGYGANEAGSGGDGLVPSLRNAYVDISQNTISLPPSITFPASLNKIEDKVFEANKAYFVSFWNNLLTIKEVTLGSTGEV